MNGITINKIHFSSSNEVKNDHENNVKIRNEIIWAAQLAGLSESQVVFFYTEDPLDSYSKPALHNIIMECRKELTIQMVNTDYLKFASIIETLIKEIILLRNKSEELYL